MGKYLAWIGTSIVTIVSFVYSVFPILTSTPRFIAIGILVICVGVLLILPVGSSGSAYRRLSRRFGGQQVTASGSARVVQGGKDVKITGGMGDR